MEDLVATFLTAFENLDMHVFIACFAEEATMFSPSPEPCERVHGRVAIEEGFDRVFARIRSQAHGGPPFHLLRTEDLLVQHLAPGAGLVSLYCEAPSAVRGEAWF